MPDAQLALECQAIDLAAKCLRSILANDLGAEGLQCKADGARKVLAQLAEESARRSGGVGFGQIKSCPSTCKTKLNICTHGPFQSHHRTLARQPPPYLGHHVGSIYLNWQVRWATPCSAIKGPLCMCEECKDLDFACAKVPTDSVHPRFLFGQYLCDPLPKESVHHNLHQPRSAKRHLPHFQSQPAKDLPREWKVSPGHLCGWDVQKLAGFYIRAHKTNLCGFCFYFYNIPLQRERESELERSVREGPST